MGARGRRVEPEKLGAPMVAGDQVDCDCLELDAEFLHSPACADRARRCEFIELHGAS
jgi:hypothetical protein